MTDPGLGRRPRIAFTVYGTALFDSRLDRMARSAISAGYEVVVYARLDQGLPREAVHHGYRVIRVPFRPRYVWPGLSRFARPSHEGSPARQDARASVTGWVRSGIRLITGAPAKLAYARWRTVRRWSRFPRSVMAWAVDLDAVAEPADIWVGRLSGGLPAAVRQARRLGGIAIYDSADVYVHSRELGRGGLYPKVFAIAERRWVRRCAAVTTASEGYADMLERQLGVRRPLVLLNCPPRTAIPTPRPDRIRERLALGGATRVVLYQGALLTERGIEESMDAILEVPDAVLVVMGFGPNADLMRARAARPEYRGKVHFIDPVPPAELLGWTASADVMVITILPTTDNHRYSVPNKIMEAIAAGTPVVASDLPGMAPIVHDAGAGVLVDPSSVTAIAAGIRELLDEPPAERQARRRRIGAAAWDRYHWESQEGPLIELYHRLAPRAHGGP